MVQNPPGKTGETREQERNQHRSNQFTFSRSHAANIDSHCPGLQLSMDLSTSSASGAFSLGGFPWSSIVNLLPREISKQVILKAFSDWEDVLNPL